MSQLKPPKPFLNASLDFQQILNQFLIDISLLNLPTHLPTHSFTHAHTIFLSAVALIYFFLFAAVRIDCINDFVVGSCSYHWFS